MSIPAEMYFNPRNGMLEKLSMHFKMYISLKQKNTQFEGSRAAYIISRVATIDVMPFTL